MYAHDVASTRSTWVAISSLRHMTISSSGARYASSLSRGSPSSTFTITLGGGRLVPYPKTLRQARAFVKKYQDYAVRISTPPDIELQRTRPAQGMEPRR